jgi:dihydrofolate reductase
MEEPWTTMASRDELPDVAAEFARIYLETPRIVFSDTLESVPDGVRLVRSTEAVAEVTRLKREADGDLNLGGANLAASLVDLIDEFRLFLIPVVLGGGKPFFGAGKLRLQLAEQRTFDSGTVFLRYERLG